MLRTVVVVTLAFSLVACSFATTRPPKSGEPDDTCNTSEVGPVLDASWAVLAGLSTLLFVQDAVANANSDEATPIVVGAAVTGLFGGAAIYGFRTIRQCRYRNKDIEARAAEAEAAQKQQPSAREAAWEMTKHAHAAAIAGDCASAGALGEVVRRTDADFYDAVYTRDVAIAHCAGAPPPGAPPGAQPPAPPPTPPPAPAADQEVPVSPP